MAQLGEPGITGIGEVVHWDSSAPTRQIFKPEPGRPSGVREARRREPRSPLVVAQKSLRVQFLEGTGIHDPND